MDRAACADTRWSPPHDPAAPYPRPIGQLWARSREPKVIRIAYSRKHQKLRRVDRSRGQDDLAMRSHLRRARAASILNSDRALPIEKKLGRKHTRPDRQILSRPDRMKIGGSGAASPAVADVHLQSGEALLIAGVVVVGRAVCGSAGSKVSIAQLVAKSVVAHRKGPLPAAINGFATFPAFLLPEIRKNIRIGPRRKPGCRPLIVIARMPAVMRHRVDRGRAANDLAACAFDGTIVHVGRALVEIAPIMQFLLHDPSPRKRNMDLRVAVPSSRLKEKNGRRRIFGQTVCQNAACRAGTYNHIIE